MLLLSALGVVGCLGVLWWEYLTYPAPRHPAPWQELLWLALALSAGGFLHVRKALWGRLP